MASLTPALHMRSTASRHIRRDAQVLLQNHEVCSFPRFATSPLSLRHSRRPWLAVNASSGDSGKEGGRPGKGNEDVQNLLADIVRLQTGREEVNQFVAEKAAMLTDLANDAGEDLKKIADGANLGMEEANTRILEEVDSQMSELEKELAAARLEQAKRDQEFEEFEKQLVEKQNEGLFFKSLYQVTKGPSPTKEEVLKANPRLANSVSKEAKSPTRRNLYGVFGLLAIITLAKAILDEASISTILACAAISLALVFRVVYELSLSEDS